MEVDLSIEVRDIETSDADLAGGIWGIVVRKGSRKRDEWGPEIMMGTIRAALVKDDPEMQAAMEAFCRAIVSRIMRMDHGEYLGEVVVRSWDGTAH